MILRPYVDVRVPLWSFVLPTGFLSFSSKSGTYVYADGRPARYSVRPVDPLSAVSGHRCSWLDKSAKCICL